MSYIYIHAWEIYLEMWGCPHAGTCPATCDLGTQWEGQQNKTKQKHKFSESAMSI